MGGILREIASRVRLRPEIDGWGVAGPREKLLTAKGAKDFAKVAKVARIEKKNLLQCKIFYPEDE
jgi:hypothetical protein